MKATLRSVVWIFFLLGMFLHGWFDLRQGHHFTPYMLLVIPIFAFHYTAPALGSFLTRKISSLSLLLVTQIGFLAFDVAHSSIWSSPDKEAAFGSALVWILESGISVAITLTIVASGFICDEFHSNPNA